MDDSDLDSFGDIITNFLGVLIVTLLLLQGTVAATDALRAPLRPGKEQPLATFSAPLRDHFHPFTDHYYVAGDLVVAIDFAKLAELVQSGALTAVGDKHEVKLLGDSLPPVVVQAFYSIPRPGAEDWALQQESDLDAYHFQLTFPTFPGPTAQALKQLESLTERIVAKTAGGTRTANFIVSDTGFALFARLHNALAQRHVCFRWIEHKSGEAKDFFRVRQQFDYYTSRKCRVRR